MNASSENSTFVECLPIILAQTSLIDRILNLLRVSLITLNFIWCVFVIAIKELRVRQMIFWNNLNAICFTNSLLLISQIAYTNCTILSDLVCFLQAYGYIITGILSGYGISALALYRVYLIKTVEHNKKLSYKAIFFSLALSWLLPISFSTIEIFVFKTKAYYYREYNFCLFDVDHNYHAYIFYIFGNFILPNIVLIGCGLLIILNNNKVGDIRQKQLRNGKSYLKHQLYAYAILFEINAIGNILIYHETMFKEHIISYEYLVIFRIFRWTHYFAALSIFYTNPIMKKKYKNWLRKLLIFFKSKSCLT